MEKVKIQSLDKNYSANIFVKRPEKYRELKEISDRYEKMIPMGSCSSYVPASFCNDNLSILMTKFNKIIEFDKVNKTITVEAGIKISELLQFTLKNKLWIPQIPGYPSITLGGIVATNAHGKSSAFHGTIRQQIKEILIYHKTHGWLNLSKDENKKIFDLTIGGFGLTGTIVQVKLKLEDFIGYNFKTSLIKTNSLIDTINNFNEENKEVYQYSWNRSDNITNLGKGFIFKNEINSIENSSVDTRGLYHDTNKLESNFKFNLWNNFTIKFSQFLYYNFHLQRKDKVFFENFKKIIFPFSGKEMYFKMFGRNGLIESQIIVPAKKINQIIDEIEFNLKKELPEITLLSIKKIKGECNYLRFENDGFCITFDFVRNKKSLNFMENLDLICQNNQLIPSIIKDSRLRLNTIKICYNAYDQFKKDLNEFDNRRIYRSQLSDILEL